MPTNYQYRMILIVPVANIAAVVTWFQNNIGPDSVSANIGPGLNAAGDGGAATHRWLSGAFTVSECIQIIRKLAQLANLTPPSLATFQSWTRAQVIAWLLSVQAAILSGYGAWVDLCGNDDVWDNCEDALTAMSLKRQST